MTSARPFPVTMRRLDRRRFLTFAGAVSGAVAASAAAISPAEAYDPGPEETKARYRESEHVKAFYRTNGYETLQK